MDYDEIYEQLEFELGREPTDEEVEMRIIDLMAHAYDMAKDLRQG